MKTKKLKRKLKELEERHTTLQKWFNEFQKLITSDIHALSQEDEKQKGFQAEENRKLIGQIRQVKERLHEEVGAIKERLDCKNRPRPLDSQSPCPPPGWKLLHNKWHGKSDELYSKNYRELGRIYKECANDLERLMTGKEEE